MEKRVVSGNILEDDKSDKSLRPKRLKDYVGQDSIKDNLSIAIKASKKRKEPLDHVLLYGPPGLGKTTLANILANEMEVRIKTTSGPAIERSGDMVAILTQLQSGDILFIDEIHRLSRVVEEVLYSAMEDFFVSWVMDKGLKARNMKLSLKPFTIIGATTRYGMVTGPLRDRFGLISRLNYYNLDDMSTVVQRSASILKINGDPKGFNEIAKRSRGTPRVANRLLKRVSDYSLVLDDNSINQKIAQESLRKLEIDELGLDSVDYMILKAIIEKFSGGPVGLDTLSASISEEAETIEEVYEPYLLQLGFLDRTSRGRMVTKRAYEHLGIKFPQKKGLNQATLFD